MQVIIKNPSNALDRALRRSYPGLKYYNRGDDFIVDCQRFLYDHYIEKWYIYFSDEFISATIIIPCTECDTISFFKGGI